jgi:hypothetical protein
MFQIINVPEMTEIGCPFIFHVYAQFIQFLNVAFQYRNKFRKGFAKKRDIVTLIVFGS